MFVYLRVIPHSAEGGIDVDSSERGMTKWVEDRPCLAGVAHFSRSSRNYNLSSLVLLLCLCHVSFSHKGCGSSPRFCVRLFVVY